MEKKFKDIIGKGSSSKSLSKRSQSENFHCGF